LFRLGLGEFSKPDPPPNVAPFVMIDYKLCSATIDNRPVIYVQFIIGRNIIGSMMTDFLPILISVIIGHLTNYVKLYEVAAGANLTILLVLVTL